jgi:hypothetical protein
MKERLAAEKRLKKTLSQRPRSIGKRIWSATFDAFDNTIQNNSITPTP